MPKVIWVLSYGFCNFIRFPAVQKFWKLVKVSQSCREFKGGNVFCDTVYKLNAVLSRWVRCHPLTAHQQLAVCSLSSATRSAVFNNSTQLDCPECPDPPPSWSFLVSLPTNASNINVFVGRDFQHNRRCKKVKKQILETEIIQKIIQD